MLQPWPLPTRRANSKAEGWDKGLLVGMVTERGQANSPGQGGVELFITKKIDAKGYTVKNQNSRAL